MTFYNKYLHRPNLLIKSFFKGACALSLIFLPAIVASSCSDELSVDPEKNSPEHNEILPAGTRLYSYIRLLPVEGAPSRADDNYGKDDNNKNGYDAEFEPGEGDESSVKNFLIIFYNSERNCVAYFDSESFIKKELQGDEVLDKDDLINLKEELAGILEKTAWDVLIPVPITTTGAIQSSEDIDNLNTEIESYFVILNYTDALLKTDDDGNLVDGALVVNNSATGGKTIKHRDDLLKVTVNNYQLSSDKGFLMTTAGRYDKNNNGHYIWYDKKEEDKDVIYLSQTAAKENPLVVYAERVAARVDLTVNKINDIEVLYKETDVYDLHFNPDAWGLEALEKTTYLPKKLDYSSKGEVPKETAQGTYFYADDFGAWSDYYNNRVFWAASPSFGETQLVYPEDGKEIKEKKELGLEYKMFNQINGELTKPIYLKEHTFRNTEFTKANTPANPYAIPTSVVLRGNYTASFATPSTDEKKPDGSVNPDKAPQDELDLSNGFYLRYVDMERTDKGSDGNETGVKRYSYHIYLGDEMLDAMLKEQFMIWKKVKVGEETIEKDVEGKIEKTVVPIYEMFPCRPSIINDEGEIEKGDEELFAIVNTNKRYDSDTGKPITASNTYTLQIKEDADLTNLFLKTSADDDEKYPLSDSDVLKKANEALQKQLGYAQYYWKGYAFFYAPIVHYNGLYDPFKNQTYKGLFKYKEEGNGYKKDPVTGNYIPDHKTADFGVVRNHIYNFTINEINGLGYGIPGEDIIPLPEPRLEHEMYQFDLELKILPWKQYNYTFDI